MYGFGLWYKNNSRDIRYYPIFFSDGPTRPAVKFIFHKSHLIERCPPCLSAGHGLKIAPYNNTIIIPIKNTQPAEMLGTQQ